LDLIKFYQTIVLDLLETSNHSDTRLPVLYQTSDKCQQANKTSI